MNKPRQIVLEQMKCRGLSRAELASAVGVTARTLENVLSGMQSRNVRQRLTDFFGLPEPIWPNIRTSGRLIRLPAGAEIEFETADQALEFAHGFGSNITIKGRSIYFVLPTRFTVQFPIKTRLRPSEFSASRLTTARGVEPAQHKKKRRDTAENHRLEKKPEVAHHDF